MKLKLNKHPSSTRKINSYLKAGLHGAEWYDHTRKVVEDKLGKELAPVFVDILAATSPNQSVKGNVTIAKRALKQLQERQAFRGYLSMVANMLNIIRINHITGHRAKFGGAKVQNFADALAGDSGAVVVDRWMLRAFGYPNIITHKRYREISLWIVTRAAQLDMSPAQVQASIWTGIKAKEDKTGMTAKSFDNFI